MNKYQEALRKIQIGLGFKLNEVEYESAFKEVKELVEKETSRKASKNLFGRLACDNCGISFQELGQQTYCKHCGQKLDWSDDD